MKHLILLALVFNSALAFAHLDDRAVEAQVNSHSKELSNLALKSAQNLLDVKSCEAGQNSPETRAKPVYKIQMIEGSFQGFYRYNTETQTAIYTFLVLKTCPNGATGNLGDLNLEAGALVKATAVFNKKDKVIEMKVDKIKEVDNSLLNSLKEFELYR